MKGSTAEYELGLMRQRALAARDAKIKRGVVLFNPPVRYVRTSDNQLVFTPDQQVRECLHTIFAKLRGLGSVRQVLLWFRDQQLRLPSPVPGTSGNQVRWLRPRYGRLLTILESPTHAGAYAWGRSKTKTAVRDGQARKTQGHPQPLREWQVLTKDHHPGHIDWQEYLEKQKTITRNSAGSHHTQSESGPAKRGPALLPRLRRCGHCGRTMLISYSGVGGVVPRYHCRGANQSYGYVKCVSFGPLRIDRAVAATVLDAVAPVGIQAALSAWYDAQG